MLILYRHKGRLNDSVHRKIQEDDPMSNTYTWLKKTQDLWFKWVFPKIGVRVPRNSSFAEASIR